MLRDVIKKKYKTHTLESASIIPSQAEEQEVKWEVKKIKSGRDKGKWGVFLMQEYCQTDEPVIYGASVNKSTAQKSVNRMNDPGYWIDDGNDHEKKN